MTSKNLRRYGVLERDDRSQRPDTIRYLGFDDLTTPGPQFRDTSGIVPIESVCTGDRQVLAARGPQPEAADVIDLDVLSGYPSVTSVVATTRVRTRKPLPAITELLLFGGTPLPDPDTFRGLPALHRVWLTWGVRASVDLTLLPPELEALGVAGHQVRANQAGDRFAVLQRFEDLRHLTLRYCLPKDSVLSIGALSNLVELNCDAPAGWARLRTCTALEAVTVIQPRIANLRSLRTWTRLRRLAIVAGAGLTSLDGLDAFSNLETLRLVLVRGQDLSPLRHLPRLRDVSINSFGHPVPLDVFTTLPALKSLTIETPGDPSDSVRVETLQPLAAVRTLESLALRGMVVTDRQVAFLADLPHLKHLLISGDFGDQVEALRRSRPDIDLRWFPGPALPAGERVGIVLVRPPVDAKSSRWWIREDLTRHLAVPTNYDAEQRVKRALDAEDPALSARLTFDTEADAVCVYGSESDIRAAAKAITRRARPSK